MQSKTGKERVEVIIKNRLGEILIGRNPRHGAYVFPGGGVDKNETILEAAKREVQEETGKNISNISRLGKDFVYRTPKGEVSSTSFCTGTLQGGPKSKNFGADNDILKDIKFRSKKEVIKLLKSVVRKGYESPAENRIKMLNKLDKRAAANDINFLRGFEDGLRKLRVHGKSNTDQLLKYASMHVNLTKPVYELIKEATNDSYKPLLGAGIGAGIGGAAGYVLTEQEEDKLKNALIGALVGAPIGGLIMSPSNLVKQDTEKKEKKKKEKNLHLSSWKSIKEHMGDEDPKLGWLSKALKYGNFNLGDDVLTTSWKLIGSPINIPINYFFDENRKFNQ